MKNFTPILGIFSIFGLLFASCDPKEPIIPNEEELITTLVVELEANGTFYRLEYKDLDGDGGNPPEIAVDSLAANTMYSANITLYYENSEFTEELTGEILDEAEAHQFFFSSTGTSTFTYTDMDANGNPVGVTFDLTTGDAGDEQFTVILRHEPNKSALGVSDGDISNAGGETDIEIVFEIHID